MREKITLILDAIDSIGATLTSIESNGLFATVQYEKDYVPCYRQIDHRMTFTEVVESLQHQYDQTRLIIQNKER